MSCFYQTRRQTRGTNNKKTTCSSNKLTANSIWQSKETKSKYTQPYKYSITTNKENMNNMNWADHCSSDDESDDGLHPARLATNSEPIEQDLSNDLSYDPSDTGALSTTGGDDDLEVEKETIPYPPEIDMNKLPENFPTAAPYTAYVGNLAFSVKTEEDFARGVEKLITFRYQGMKRVKVIGARFGIDREKKRKPFGYVEFETPEDLMLFLNVNDGYSMMRGRKIIIDVAKSQSHGHRNKERSNSHHGHKDHRKGGDFANIDGSKFRGGIHTEKSNKPSERVPLKLEPRSKPLEDVGGGKPSDDMNWRSASSRDSSDHGRGGRGRGRGRSGGRGRGSSGGRDGGRGVVRKNHQASNPVKKEDGTSEDGWDSAPKTFKSENAAINPVVKEEKKSVTKVSNTFAALQVDSDSD